MDSRTVQLIGRARNGWIWSFARASLRISQAIGDGRISVADIDAFPLGDYDVEACRTIASAAGMRLALSASEVKLDTGLGCECEDIETAIEAIRGLAANRVCTYDEADAVDPVWHFYQEDVDASGTTIREVRRSLQGIGIADAAALIVAGDDWFRGKVQAEREPMHAAAPDGSAECDQTGRATDDMGQVTCPACLTLVRGRHA